MSAKPTVARPSMLSLSIPSKSALYASFIPMLKNGGIFIPTSRVYALGDNVFVLLSLLEDPAKLAVAGKVVWVTPANAQNNHPQGIGIQFNVDESGVEAKRRIEGILAGLLTSSRPTYTV